MESVAEAGNGKEKLDSTLKIHLIYAVVILFTLTLFCAVIYMLDRPGVFKLQLGNHQVEIDFKGDTLSVKTLLDTLFSDEEKQRESCALLKEFARLYQPTDPSLVEAIEEQDKRSKVAENLRQLLYELKGPFDRSMHSFYDVEQPRIVDAIEVLGFNHPVSRRLRELLVYRKGPFEEQASKITFRASASDDIQMGRAASCKSNEFYKQEILVFNKQKTHSVSVFVSDSFPCPEGQDGLELLRLLHLSQTDIENLLGDIPAGNVSGYAEIALNM